MPKINFLYSKWTRWIVSLTLVGILYLITDTQLILSILAKAQFTWLSLGFLCTLFLTAFGAVKWWFLMPRSHTGPLSFIRVNFISNFVGIFVPGIVGIEAARIAGITKSSKDLPAAFASVLVDRLFGLLTLGLMVAMGALVARELVPSVVTTAGSVIVLGIIIGMFTVMNYKMRSLLAKVLPKKLNTALVKLFDCLDLYRDQKGTLIVSFLLSIFFQFARVAMVYLLTFSLLISVEFKYLMIVVPVALFVQMIPISIYGIGLRESAMISLLAVVGVSTENAIALSILLLAVQIASALPGGILFALGHRLENK